MKPENFSRGMRDTAKRYGMDLARPIALVSGGPDSVALLRALVELGSEPVVLHVEHGIRGEESRRDAGFVVELCDGLGLHAEVRGVHLGEGNVQDEARRERYRLAEEVASERGLSAILTGHTEDDVAETVLMNLARGAGLRGLSGIPPVRGRVARPLIRHGRHDVLRYLEFLGQSYRIDSTNLTGKYARNRVRLEVLPILEALYPGAAGNMARGAGLLREDLEVLEGLAAAVVRSRGGEVVIELDGLRAMPRALRRYAVRQAYSSLASGTRPLDSAAVESVLELIRKTEGTRTLNLPGGVTVAARFGEELAMYHEGKQFSGVLELRAGVTHLEGWVIQMSEVSAFDLRDAARPETAYLDASLGPYAVRVAREGDVIRPLGLGGEKTVFRAMMDRKVPRDVRRRTPVVVDRHDRVAWVLLGELHEEFKVTPATERILRLEVEKSS